MRRAAVLMILAGLSFATMIALVKTARAQMGPLELVMWRGVVAAPLALALSRGASRLVNRRLFALRTALGFSAMICYYTAAKHLMVANLNLIAQLQPLIIALAAPLVLGASERAGGLLWGVLVAGFAGGAMILAPDLAVGSAWGLLAVLAACLSAAARISLRGLMRTDHPGAVVLYFQTSMSLLGAAGVMVQGALPALPPSSLWPHVLGIGATATLGQLLMTWAHHAERATVAAAASYSSVIWAVLADLVVFGVAPGWNVLTGGALIVGAGLWLVVGRAPATPAADGTTPE